MYSQTSFSWFLCKRNYWYIRFNDYYGTFNNGRNRWWRNCYPVDQRIFSFSAKTFYFTFLIFNFCMLCDKIYFKLFPKASRKESYSLSWLRSCNYHDANCYLWFFHWSDFISNSSRHHYSSNFRAFVVFLIFSGCTQSKSDDQKRKQVNQRHIDSWLEKSIDWQFNE